MRKRFWTAFGLCALSGVFYFTGFVDFGIWPLAFVCFVPLLWALRGASSLKQAFLMSWWMGTATFLGGYYWLVHLFQEFASFPLFLAFPLYLVFCAAQGLQFGLIGTLTWKTSRSSGISMGWLLPPALAAGEFAIPLFFQSYLANSLAYVPQLIQPADLGGVLLVSFIVASVSGALYEVISARAEHRPFPWAAAAVCLALVAADLGYSAGRIRQMDARDAAAEKVTTAMIQGNVGGIQKHEALAEGILRFRVMTEDLMRDRPDVGLIVWPESAFNEIVLGRINLTGLVASSVRVPMVVGLLRQDGRTGAFYNSVAAVAEGGWIVGFYDKTILVAFGEYMPGDRWLRPLYEKFLNYTNSFSSGTSAEPLQLGRWRLSADVCYEDIVASHIRTLMAPNVAGKTPNAMINVTNDSWYGPSEPPIHLALAVFRSVEHRRWLIRSTATGISAFVDSSGRLVRRSGYETQEILLADVPMIDEGPTFYGRFGDWPGWLCLALMAFLLIRAWIAGRRRPSPESSAPSAEEAREKQSSSKAS
jgi:apolipoprotein N-acyltransferase